MSFSVEFRPAARAEFDEAFDWYERQRPGLGVEFAASVRETLERIGGMPGLYPRVRGDVRRAVVHRFPFAVYYRVEAERIIVLAVFHGKRNPRVWQRRT